MSSVRARLKYIMVWDGLPRAMPPAEPGAAADHADT